MSEDLQPPQPTVILQPIPAPDVHVHNNLRPTHEEVRRQLWIGVAVAVAGSWNCKNKAVPGSWADAVLKDFDKRFAP